MGKALRVMSGMALSVPIHVLGLVAGVIAVIALGLGPRDKPWPQSTQEAFLMSFGLWQWLYLIPVIRLLQRRRAYDVSSGVIVSGLLRVACSAVVVFGVLWKKLGG